MSLLLLFVLLGLAGLLLRRSAGVARFFAKIDNNAMDLFEIPKVEIPKVKKAKKEKKGKKGQEPTGELAMS